MTHLDDRQLLERFDRRMAGIESEVPTPPAWHGPDVEAVGSGLGVSSMFHATRFVVAGVIVALIGGFLLGGLLTQRADDMPPAPAASPSPSPERTYVVGGRVVSAPSGPLKTSLFMATHDALWVPGNDGVVRIDREPGLQTTIPGLPETKWLVATEDAVWAVEPHAVHRIDRDSLVVTDSIEAGSKFDFSSSQPLIVEGSLWMTSTREGLSTLVEIDLGTRSLRDEYMDDDLSPGQLIAVDDAIWVYSQSGGGERLRLTRFDLESRAFTDAVEIPGTGSLVCGIAIDDAIWLVDERGLVRRFDLDALEITDTVELEHQGRGGASGGVVADGAIWVSARDVYRIDPRTREVTDVIEVGWSSEPPAFLHGAIWIAGNGDKAARIDVRTRQVTDTFRLYRMHLHTPLASEGVIWVRSQEGNLRRIDEVAATE